MREEFSAMTNGWVIVAILLCTISRGGNPAAPDIHHPDIENVVQQSAHVTEADRIACQQYDFTETDLESDGSHKTFAVHMLYGSPYDDLVAIDGTSLPPDKQAHQLHKLKQTVRRRQHESPHEHSARVSEYQREQNRDRRFMEEFTRAFNFKLLGEQTLNGHDVYAIEATPKPGYRPTDSASKVLTGMRGELWIDKQTFQWVKVEAQVIHPVSIAGFLARVEPGTRFELEKAPVNDGVWLPTHYSMTAEARVLWVISHRGRADE